jgi:uncharacterized protein (TIRG00374 family)
MTLGWMLVRGIAWRALLRNQASYIDVFLTLNEGYLLNNLLPLRLGELGRAFLLSRKTQIRGGPKLGFWQVLSTILVERALDMGMVAALLLSTLPFVAGVPWAQQAAIGTGLLVLIGLIFLYLLGRNKERALSIFNRFGQRVPFIQRIAGHHLTAFLDGMAALTEPRWFLRGTGWILVNWILAVLQYHVFLSAFFPQAQPIWAAFSLSVGALGVAAPSSPGAVGVYEAAMVGALAVFGVEPSAAAACAFTAHFFNYLVTGSLGGYALARDGESLTGLYRRLQAEPRS